MNAKIKEAIINVLEMNTLVVKTARKLVLDFARINFVFKMILMNIDNKYSCIYKKKI